MSESNTDGITHICPEESVLGYVGPTACPTCNMEFPNRTSCEFHQIKKHNKKSSLLDKKPEGTFRYYCPMSGCKYNKMPDRNLDSTRSFKKMKYLQQHYNKTHAKKKFVCSQCEKSFPSSIQLDTHKRKECGIEFSCIQCNTTYKSREALLTHCSRNGHNKSGFQIKREGKIQFVSSSSVVKGQCKKILPKPLAPGPHLMENIAAAALSELSRKPIVRTGVDVSTQTEVVPEPKERAKAGVQDAAACSSSTQTDDRIFSDAFFTDELQYLTSATQTNEDMVFLRLIQDLDQHVNNETQTEFPPNHMMLDEDIPALSDTHTQTATDLDECSHTFTQTNEDYFLNDFNGFSDIETQTGWDLDPLLTSAQTQTLL
uniref:ATM interactor n=1 Tax=Lygus hesperus TaxID=30085 RepID=A0A0A9X214_LYGHE